MAKAHAAVNHVRAFRHEDCPAEEAAALVAGWDAPAPDIWLDALDHHDAIVRLPDDGDGNPATDTEAVARAAEISHEVAHLEGRPRIRAMIVSTLLQQIVQSSP